MSRAVVSKHYARIASQWPKDVLRPEVQFQKLLNARIANAPSVDAQREELLGKVLGSKPSPRAPELSEVNALYSLLENRYSKLHPIPEAMMAPKSDPEYYTRLRQQLDETPNRSWFSDLARRLGGMVRLR
ncbi:hypothetical protein K461DRAFT_319745 [Myriangium duriaei CBS 260.36]|uniref:Uncharacterized protein n=1 Tax=Myriangium duriaei CBS 260.36 TaxID=1168546 RepID=A0A9P4J5R7_9PEZI|nr:hypothetical protein K461DRAFT_319745 [Myriangium duriaei CBS 260.36]